MSLLDLVPTQYRTAAIALALFLLAAVSAGTGWLAQGWRMGEQMQEQGRELDRQIAARDQLHADTLAELARASNRQLLAEQDKRRALEAQLSSDSATHHKVLTDAQKSAARLRDRLATAELRLSVLLAGPAASRGDGDPGLQPSASTGGVVHAASRADIDPGAAQRIVAIAVRGDDAIIALTACQAYARGVSALATGDE